MPNTSITFPASPAVNQQHTYGTTTYVWTGTSWMTYIDSASLMPTNPAAMTRQQFSGTGSQTVFTLAADPGALGNGTHIYINGVYQQKATYTTVTTTLTFSSAPPLGTNNIEVVSFVLSSVGTTDSALVTYLPSGTGAVTRTAQAKMRDTVSINDYDTVANYKANRVNIVSIDGSNRLFAPYVVAGTKSFGSVGDTWASTAGLRDSFTASQDLTGLTDCHAFSDKTVIDLVADAGTYGTFDSTTILRGSHVQNHIHSFQDRQDYQGSGTLTNQIGLYSFPIFSGSGTIQNRHGVYVGNINKTGSGVVDAQIGVLIADLNAATSNVGLNIQQIGGYSIYAAGGAKMWNKGAASFGTVDNTGAGVALTARGSNITGPYAFLHSSASNVQVGLLGGDYAYQILTNGAVRLEVTPSSGSYTFRPGADNTQPLGDVTKRWSQLFAGTAVINTSDANEKQQIQNLNEQEKAVAIKIKSMIKTYKFNNAVKNKGNRARIHVGVVAQEVEQAFISEGLDPCAYGLFCLDTWYEYNGEVVEVDANKMTTVIHYEYNGKKIDKLPIDEEGKILLGGESIETKYLTEEKTLRGIRYDELLAFIIASI